MGLLDDAIREHLALKRTRGADPGEVAQQEQEALGPVRREPESAPATPELEAEPEGDELEPDETEPDELALDEAEEAEIDEPDPVDPDATQIHRGPGGTVPAGALGETEEWGFEDAAVEPEAEDVPNEDVLEQTPEFLAETPEHDRLWFEQKPPRDFDFDK